MAISRAHNTVEIEAHSPIHVRGAENVIFEMGDPDAIAQAAWFIDPINGNDLNTGLTAATAIRTHEEFRKRIGTQIIGGPNGESEITIPVNMVVTLLNDFPQDNPVYIDFEIGNQGTLTYKNGKTLTTLFTSGPATVYTATSENTNVQQLVSDPTAPVSWAAGGLINAPLGAAIRIRLTSGASSGAIAWTMADSGANTARVSSFTTFITSVPTAASPSPALTPVNGDTFVVESGFVSIADFRVSSRGNSFGSSSGASTRLFFLELKLPQGQGQKPLVSFIQSQNAPNGFPEIFFSSCDVGTIEPRRATFVALSNCKISGFASLIADGRLSVASGMCTQTINFQGASAQSQLFFNFVIQGGNLFVNVSNIICDRVGVFDSIGDAILVLPGACYRAENLFGFGERTYGSGATGRFIRVRTDGTFAYQTNKPTGTGGVGLDPTSIGGVSKPYAEIPFAALENYVLHTGVIGPLTGAVTRFALPNYTEGLTANPGFLVEQAATLKNLRVFSVTPAGAGGDTYTVFVNGVATTLVAIMAAGTTTALAVSTLSAQVLVGDRVSVQIVEGAAGASDVSIAVEVLSNSSNCGKMMLRN